MHLADTVVLITISIFVIIVIYLGYLIKNGLKENNIFKILSFSSNPKTIYCTIVLGIR